MDRPDPQAQTRLNPLTRISKNGADMDTSDRKLLNDSESHNVDSIAPSGRVNLGADIREPGEDSFMRGSGDVAEPQKPRKKKKKKAKKTDDSFGLPLEDSKLADQQALLEKQLAD